MLQKSTIYLIVLVIFGFFGQMQAQEERPETSQTSSPSSAMWLGTYGKFRLSDKLYWDAQFHYRRVGDEDLRYAGRMAQIYNRHALNYRVADNFSVSLGPVLRLNFSPDPGNSEFEDLVLEPRIWHEYLFAMPFPRFMVYHRLRIEHRWSRGNRVDAEWIYRDRWRYKFYMNIPINNDKLVPGTFYFSPDFEIIMQSGKAIIDSPLEDFRVNPTIGYIASPRTKYTVSMMYTTGQSLDAGYNFNSRWVFRLNLYLSLDFRKMESKIPATRIDD
ncbi:MAG: DUF2490 domain-containing protein [Gillisia sp.]